MPDPEFTLAPGTNNWMQDFAWDPLKDEIFMTQNIRTSNGRQTIKINRLGRADDQGVRRFISAMTLTDAGHGDVLGLQRKGNVPGYRSPANPRIEVSPAPASGSAGFAGVQPASACVGRRLPRIYVGLSIPVPSSMAMTAASATRYQMNTVMLCLATNRSNQAIDA